MKRKPGYMVRLGNYYVGRTYSYHNKPVTPHVEEAKVWARQSDAAAVARQIAHALAWPKGVPGGYRFYQLRWDKAIEIQPPIPPEDVQVVIETTN